MSAIKRFKARQNAATVLEVPWPRRKPVLVFQVHRFAKAEQLAAEHAAERHLAKDRAYGRDEPGYQSALFLAYLRFFADQVSLHIKGWRKLDPEKDAKLVETARGPNYQVDQDSPEQGGEAEEVDELPEFDPKTFPKIYEEFSLDERMDLSVAYTQVLAAELKKNEA